MNAFDYIESVGGVVEDDGCGCKHGTGRWLRILNRDLIERIVQLLGQFRLIGVERKRQSETRGLRLDEIERVPLIVSCQVGQRCHTAARLLAQYGHDVRNLDGGYLTWRAGMASAQIPQGVY